MPLLTNTTAVLNWVKPESFNASLLAMTNSFKNGAKLYYDEGQLPSADMLGLAISIGGILEGVISTNPYLGYLLNSASAERAPDYKKQGTSLQEAISQACSPQGGYVGVSDVSAVNFTPAEIAATQNLGAFLGQCIIVNQVSSRPWYSNGRDPSGPGGGGGPTTNPVPLLQGALWNPSTYAQQDFQFMPIVRSGKGSRPRVDRFRPHQREPRATIRIMGSSTSGNKCYYATSNFFLKTVQKDDVERMAVLKSFDGDMPFFIGSEARLYRFQGFLLNTQDYDWARSWFINWKKYMAGHVTTENNARFYILYGGWMYGGHLVDTAIQENATAPYIASISFTVFVIDAIPLPKMIASEKGDNYVMAGEKHYTEKDILDPKSGDEYAKQGMNLDEATAALYSILSLIDEEYPSGANPPEGFDPPPPEDSTEE